MSSSEQAPEPTMDEILASIRKIISDDEPGEAAEQEEKASGTGTPEAAAPTEGAPENDGLSDDLAKALNTAPERTETPDPILDLTQVVEQQTSIDVEAATAPHADPPPGPPQGDALQDALKDVAGGETAISGTSDPGPETASERNISDLLAEAGVQDTPEQAQMARDASMEAPRDDELGTALGPPDHAVAPAVDSSMPDSEFGAMAEPAPEAAAEAPGQGVEPPPSVELPDVPLADAVADEQAADTMADTPAAEKVTDEAADAFMAKAFRSRTSLSRRCRTFRPSCRTANRKFRRSRKCRQLMCPRRRSPRPRLQRTHFPNPLCLRSRMPLMHPLLRMRASSLWRTASRKCCVLCCASGWMTIWNASSRTR